MSYGSQTAIRCLPNHIVHIVVLVSTLPKNKMALLFVRTTDGNLASKETASLSPSWNLGSQSHPKPDLRPSLLSSATECSGHASVLLRLRVHHLGTKPMSCTGESRLISSSHGPQVASVLSTTTWTNHTPHLSINPPLATRPDPWLPAMRWRQPRQASKPRFLNTSAASVRRWVSMTRARPLTDFKKLSCWGPFTREYVSPTTEMHPITPFTEALPQSVTIVRCICAVQRSLGMSSLSHTISFTLLAVAW